MTIRFRLTDYYYVGHQRIIAGFPFDAGWTQGFGFFMVEVRWNRGLR